jgi:hypothetical protein
MDRRICRMKIKLFDEWDYNIMKNLKKGKQRVIGYVNLLDFFNISRYGDVYTLFLSLNPEGLKLTDIGYNDEWSKKNNKVIEQFEVKLTKKQLKELIKELNEKVKKWDLI